MIALQKPSVDWITLTTFKKEIGVDWRAKIFSDGDFIRIAEQEEARHLQYKGFRVPADGGTIFWGRAEQGRGKRSHWLVMVSGRLADEVVFGELQYLLWQGDERINCTRIDYQVTQFDEGILDKEKSSIKYLRGVFQALQDRDDFPLSWIQDKGGSQAIATIGIGKRKNPTYRRIYAKPLKAGHALRWEVEYKGDKAKSALGVLIGGGGRDKVGNVLRWELRRLKSMALLAYFDSALPSEGFKLPTYKREAASSVELWLIKTVLPSFERFVGTNERGDFVGALFAEAYHRGMDVWEDTGRWRQGVE